MMKIKVKRLMLKLQLVRMIRETTLLELEVVSFHRMNIHITSQALMLVPLLSFQKYSREENPDKAISEKDALISIMQETVLNITI